MHGWLVLEIVSLVIKLITIIVIDLDFGCNFIRAVTYTWLLTGVILNIKAVTALQQNRSAIQNLQLVLIIVLFTFTVYNHIIYCTDV